MMLIENKNSTPYTFENKVTDSIKLIRDFSNCIDNAHSTSERIMVAFALFRDDILEECRYSERDIAWRRLDDAQRQVIKQWQAEPIKK